MKHFQARSPLLDEQSKSTKNEQRINALLRRAQSCCDDVDKLHKEQRNSYESRKSKLLVWRKMMFDKINQIYGSCLTDFQQSFHLLNSFRDLMLVILNDRQESHIDANKLSILENEICILRCLTYHLDTSKVKFDGKLRIIGSQWSSSHSILLGNHEQMQNKHENEQPDVMKDIPCRILVDKDTLTKIQDLDVFKESIQMRNHQVNDGQPERVLTISGKEKGKRTRRLLISRMNSFLVYFSTKVRIMCTSFMKSFHICTHRRVIHVNFEYFFINRMCLSSLGNSEITQKCCEKSTLYTT